MTRRTIAVVLIGVPLVIAVALAGHIAAWHPLPVPDAVLADRFIRVAGVAHIHTTLSDGGGSIDDVRAAAAAAGLDFVIITDHNTLAAKPREGYAEEGVLTIVGTEISNHEGHLLAVGLPVPTYRFSGDGLDALEDIRDAGGLAFAAHPDSPREDLRWTGWSLPGNWGLEVMNGDSQWRAAGWGTSLGAALLYPLNPTYALLGLLNRPPALDRWDSLLADREAAALAGADAHGRLRPAPAFSLPLPSYRAVFGVVQNYVLLETPLTGEARADIDAILSALGRGRAYIGVGGLARADRFYFVAERGDVQRTMGDVLAPGAPVRLRAGGALPSGTITTLFRDGVPIATSRGLLDERVTRAGVYRVEVHVSGWDVPWIISNPIYLLAEDTRARRARAAALPPQPRADAAVVLDRFDATTSFEAVADGSTTLEGPGIDPTGGPDGSAAAQLAFVLGTPSRDHPSPFASLGSYRPRDLSGHEGLVVSVRSDDTYRVWVQIRDRNPSAPEGSESWTASVKTTSEWRTVTIPFSRLRSVEPRTDHQLDLSDVEALVFLVDVGAVPPGTSGVIWVDDLGLY